MKILFWAVALAAMLLGVLFLAGCGGGSAEGPTVTWTIRNSGGAFSGVTAARFAYLTKDSSGDYAAAHYTVLNQDSSTVSLSHSLPSSIAPLPGLEFSVYLPAVWRDSDGDRWADDSETQYLWESSGYYYYLVYGTTNYTYPGWSKWRLWYSNGVPYKQFVSQIGDEISGDIYTGFYSTRSLDDSATTVKLSEVIKDVASDSAVQKTE